MRACWLKWVGRDWSISADYIWLNYSGANNAQPISFPPRFTEPDSHLIVGTGFQNARFRIQNHFFCLGGRPTIFVV